MCVLFFTGVTLWGQTKGNAMGVIYVCVIFTGVTLWGLWKGNAMGVIWVNDEPYEFSLSESYLFASFIVAVDPVAVSTTRDDVSDGHHGVITRLKCFVKYLSTEF